MILADSTKKILPTKEEYTGYFFVCRWGKFTSDFLLTKFSSEILAELFAYLVTAESVQLCRWQRLTQFLYSHQLIMYGEPKWTKSQILYEKIEILNFDMCMCFLSLSCGHFVSSCVSAALHLVTLLCMHVIIPSTCCSHVFALWLLVCFITTIVKQHVHI